MTGHDDRTVHAVRRHDGAEIVRYDRAGKWYLERVDGSRSPLTLRGAVREAVGGRVHFGRPGGRIFDAAVVRAREADAERVLVVPEAVDASGLLVMVHLPSQSAVQECDGDCWAHETACGLTVGAPGAMRREPRYAVTCPTCREAR